MRRTRGRLASVADDNMLHVWKMAETIYNDKKYSEENLNDDLLD